METKTNITWVRHAESCSNILSKTNFLHKYNHPSLSPS